MIDFNLQIDNVVEMNSGTDLHNVIGPSFTKSAHVFSNDTYILGYDSGYYDKTDYRVVLSSVEKDDFGYSFFPIGPFLGCHGGDNNSTLTTEEGVLQISCVIDNSII